MKLKVLNESCSTDYGENSQRSLIRYAILRSLGKGNLAVVSAFFKCRDFFNEVITADTIGRRVGAYGFNVGPGTTIVNDDRSAILIAHPEVEQVVDNLSTIIAQIQPEDMYGIESYVAEFNLAKVNSASNKDLFEAKDHRFRVLYFSTKWLSSHLTFSVFTNLVRMCSYDVVFDKDKTFQENMQLVVECESARGFDNAAAKRFAEENIPQLLVQNIDAFADTPNFDGALEIKYAGPENYVVGDLPTVAVHDNTGWRSILNHGTITKPQQELLRGLIAEQQRKDKAA